MPNHYRDRDATMAKPTTVTATCDNPGESHPSDDPSLIMPDLPSGTVTFLFTDIEGSTALWERDRDAMEVAVDRHVVILQEAIAAQDGVLFKTIGDAIQAAFPTVPKAIAAAIHAQVAMRREDWGDLGPLHVRMAIHAGEAIPRDGDYLAPALNRLSRVLGTGYGEQILLTDAARTLATTLPVGYALQDLGRHRLRDLLEAERIFQLCGPGLPADFPPLKSLDQQPNNLPAQSTALLGREDELASLREMLVVPETRLVTLTGPGGTGKTRLALQATAESLDAFPDGVWFVPLAPVSDPALVPEAIATALGVRQAPGEQALSNLTEHLRSRQTLLVLDNLEQVVDAAPMIGQLIEKAPRLVVLATSREPLRLRAEREFPIPPLPVPGERPRLSLEEALASPAVQLFVERAQTVKPEFTLNVSNVVEVVTICRRLDGLPLAIELAAARVRILPPAALLARLDRRLAILTGGARDLPARQQALRATIAWSHDLLDPPEQMLFARLGVFAGGFSFEAAEAICSAAGGLEIDLFEGIASLVQKSLLRQEESPGGENRFTMLQTILEFAQERLGELPEATELRRAHADAFLALAEAADKDVSADEVALLNRLEADHANLRQAISFYEQQGDAGLVQRVRLAASLAYFWWLRGHFNEGRGILERAIATRGDIPSAEYAAAISGAAFLAEAQGDLERAQALHEEALVLYQESGDMKGVAGALGGLGTIARQRGDLDTARSRHQDALDTWRRLGDAAGAAGALLDLGLTRQLEGDYAGAEPELLEGLDLFRQAGDRSGEAHALNRLGFLATATGNLPTAIERFSQSLNLWRVLGNQQMIAADLHNLGEARHLSGSFDEAEPLYREALGLFDALDDVAGRAFALCHLGLLALDRGNPLEAQELLLESLKLRWSAGLRGLAADTLEALAEVTWQLGDLDHTAMILQASNQLRDETGVARQPVYEKRYQQIVQAVSAGTPITEAIDVEGVVAMFTGSTLLATPAKR
jgi:predicted ATPase/class 3 adenylate cyclase